MRTGRTRDNENINIIVFFHKCWASSIKQAALKE